MSQLADLESTFNNLKNRYGWTPTETAANFLQVLGCLEWELEYKDPPQIWNDRAQRMMPDYEKKEELEMQAAIKIFKD